MSAPAVRSMDRWGKSRCRNRPIVHLLELRGRSSIKQGDVDVSDSDSRGAGESILGMLLYRMGL